MLRDRAFVLAGVFAGLAVAAPASAATITVDTNADVGIQGSCALMDAITAANKDKKVHGCHTGNGADRIVFDLPGSTTIQPAEQLPDVTKPVTIDGTTQPGAGSDPGVTLDAPGPGTEGIEITGKHVTLRGFTITDFSFEAVRISGEDVKVFGNLIGVNEDGNSHPNGTGVSLETGGNVVGGLAPSKRNVISANTGNGVYSSGDGNAIQGNYIGIDSTGTLPVPNGFAGVTIGAGIRNMVQFNVISGNAAQGIVISNGGQGGRNKVRGNVIGLDATGTQTIPNGGAGIRISASKRNLIGGTKQVQSNVISGNGGDGIEITDPTATGNSLLRNSIFANGGLAIDLGGNGPTANDVGAPPDTDTGPNGLQNFPALLGGDEQTDKIFGSLDSTPETSFRVEFFISPDTGDAKKFVGAKTITTNAAGHKDIALKSSRPLHQGEFATATATRLHGKKPTDTSELSPSADISLGP